MKRTVRYVFPVLLGAAVLALNGCSESPAPAPEKKAEQKSAPAPLSGQSALFEIYKFARQWSSDVQILELETINIDSVKAQPGKSGAWSAVLVSPSKGRKKTFTWCAVEESATLHKDVFGQAEESYVKSPQANPFAIQDVRIDTIAALETARKEAAAAAYEKKNPDSPMTYRLEWTTQTPQPAWRVVWGRSVSTAGFSAYISAVDGKFLKRAQ
jgi:hypothetical protein